MPPPTPIPPPDRYNMPAAWADVRVCSLAALAANEMEPGDMVDGVTLADGDRILVADPDGRAENGLWVAGVSPARAADAASGAAFVRHRAVRVTSGTQHAGRVFRYIGKAAPVLETDPLEFAASPLPRTP